MLDHPQRIPLWHTNNINIIQGASCMVTHLPSISPRCTSARTSCSPLLSHSLLHTSCHDIQRALLFATVALAAGHKISRCQPFSRF